MQKTVLIVIPAQAGIQPVSFRRKGQPSEFADNFLKLDFQSLIWLDPFLDSRPVSGLSLDSSKTSVWVT